MLGEIKGWDVTVRPERNKHKLHIISKKELTPAARWGIALGIIIIALMWIVVGIQRDHEIFAAEDTARIVGFFIGFFVLMALLAFAVAWTIHKEDPAERPAWFFPLIAGVVTFAVVGLSYVYIGFWPFGDVTCVVGDMYVQYMPLAAYFRDILLGDGGNLLYSLQSGLGLSMLPTFGYYLASPFNLLLLLFPEEHISEFFLLITLLKTVFSAVSFACLVQYCMKKRSWAVPVCAILYATCMYMVAFSWNIMWLDVIMILPIVILAFERMMENGKMLMYILTLAYAVFANFYLSYMLCMFLVLYFVAYCIRTGTKGELLKVRIVRMIVGSAFGGLLMTFLILPTYLDLQLTSAAGDTSNGWSSNYNLFELWSRQFFGVAPSIVNEQEINIGCGLLPLLAVPLYATTQTIRLRERLSNLGMWAVLALSLVVSEFNLFWHGGHYPNGIPYRFAFLYVFVVLLITCSMIQHLQDIQPKQLLLCAGGVILYIFVMETVGTEEFRFASIYFTAIFVCIYCAVFALCTYQKLKKEAVCALLLFCVAAEALFSGNDTRTQMNENGSFASYSNFATSETHQLHGKTLEATAALGEENDFYRITNLSRFTYLDGALYNYNTDNIFASTYYYTTTQTMQRLGRKSNGVNSHYSACFMPTIDSLLGVRYFVTDTDIADQLSLKQVDSVSSGELSEYIYYNEDAVPLGFVGTSALKDWKSTEYSPFDTQNTLYTALTGNANPVLMTNSIASENQTVATTSGSSFLINQGYSSATLQINVEHTGKLFLYVDCTAAESVTARSSSNSIAVYPEETGIHDLGILQAGDTATVTIETEGGQTSGNIYAMTIDEEVYLDATEQLKQNGLSLTDYQSDSHMTGTVTAQQDGVFMTTIAYDEGWTVTVDGERVDTFGVDDSLLAFDITAGTHEIELQFWPRGLTAGICVSIAVLILLIVWQTTPYRRRMKRPLRPRRNKNQ